MTVKVFVVFYAQEPHEGGSPECAFMDEKRAQRKVEQLQKELDEGTPDSLKGMRGAEYYCMGVDLLDAREEAT